MESLFNDVVFANLPCHRINAIDGHCDLPKILHPEFITKKRVSNGDLACLVSHMQAIKAFADSGYRDYALILEDDVTLEYKPFWRQPLQEVIDNAPEDWKIIMLGQTVIHGKSSMLRQIYNRNTEENIFFSAFAYLIKKDAAITFSKSHFANGKFVLTYAKENILEADHYLYRTVGITYAYRYPFFTYSFENQSCLNHNKVLFQDSKRRIDNIMMNDTNDE
jgi:GR25 family glycosyltransferase involved in LPS biosynthesis